MNGSFFNGNSYDYEGKPPEYSESFSVKRFLSENREIIAVPFCLGAAVCAYLLLGSLFSEILVNNETLYKMYESTGASSMLLQMFYSLFCVALPFGVIYLVMLKVGITKKEIPFNKPHSLIESILLILAGIGVCMLGNVLSSYIITFAQSAGISFRSYYQTVDMQESYPTEPLLIVLNIFRIAIVPALAEEIAFRGCLMQPLRKYGDAFAVVCSGIMFGMVHGNFTQAPFACIVGIVLGLLCVYTGSIWPGIILHCLNNSISTIQSYLINNLDRSHSIYIQMLVIYGLAAIGIIALVGYIVVKHRFPQIYKNTKEYVHTKWAFFFVSPTVLVALLYLCYKLYKDIIFI